ncbi:uncharacterized protein [Macrobrachium rosenbergii]|uniref:uncharacterized protein n=1 Tax=Macrobrachium rosenbergii TaxID=79674 RepID=UPI0034D6333E
MEIQSCVVTFLLILIVEIPQRCEADSGVPLQYHESLRSTISYEDTIDEELKRHHLGHHTRHEKGVLRRGPSFPPEKQRQYFPQGVPKERISAYQSRETFQTPVTLKGESRPHSSRKNREERDGEPRAVGVTSESSVLEENSIHRIVDDDAPPDQTERGGEPPTEGQGIKEADADIATKNENNRISSISVVSIESASDLKAIGHPFCRSKEKFLPPELYALDSCTLCYSYILNRDLFRNRWNISEERDRIYVYGNQTFYYNIFVLKSQNDDNFTTLDAKITSETLLESFAGEEGRQKWISCCNAAVECCSEMLTQTWPDGYCPPTWDGWQCWPSSLPSTVVQRACPSYSYFGKPASCSKMATKKCEADGHWYRRGVYEWSNYSSCSVAQNIIRRLYVHTAAYSISVAALLPALCIFFAYKQLRVHRITLHKHLFISLLIEAIGNIILKLIQLHVNDLIQENPSWCIALNLLRRYANLTNYMWYFCEGYYLHKLLASAFAEQNNLITFYIIGWVLPLIPLSIYAIFRAIGSHNSHCWLVPLELDWIINFPPLLALVVNVVFLVNIIRILVNKVRASNSNEPSQYRKAVRATMMVIPLFGLQYIVTIYRPHGVGCDWYDFYQTSNSVIEGGTGAVVAIIFCYTNGEVKTLLRRSWVRLQERRAPRGSYRGSLAVRSRSCSTVQTTLLDPSPARRNSSIVSICANSQIVRRSNSGANSQMLTLRGSRTSISQLPLPTSNADYGGMPLTSAVRRSPKVTGERMNAAGSERALSSRNSTLNLDSNSVSRSPSLLEEIEDNIPNCRNEAERDKGESQLAVVFRKDDNGSSVSINMKGQPNSDWISKE